MVLIQKCTENVIVDICPKVLGLWIELGIDSTEEYMERSACQKISEWVVTWMT